MRFAKIENDEVFAVVEAEEGFFTSGVDGWVDVTDTQVSPNWTYVEGVFAEPPPECLPTTATLAEWMNSFTPAEWENAEHNAHKDNPQWDDDKVKDAARQAWRQKLDVVKASFAHAGGKLDLTQDPIDDYYVFLVDWGFLTEERKAELQCAICVQQSQGYGQGPDSSK